MHAIKQKCRPKHQVLILKCYPRTTKGATDVKPNSSELSYLLFYATSRKSKIQKIGAFLEKKTASDVWRMRIGNVQVTLGILAALIEKSPKDVVLIAPCVLKILDLILRSNDITMIESSLPAFDAFCEHHDASSLFADQAYSRQYESVVQHYATLATSTAPANKGGLSRSVQARWRTAGLKAIRSVATSEPLASVTGRQLNVIVPLILENLWTTDEQLLDTLLQRMNVEDKVDSERMLRRRTSIATAGTADTGEPHPEPFAGSPTDADRLVEEDIGVLAMQCLKSIYVGPNRAQIHTATAALLTFILKKIEHGQRVVELAEAGKNDSGWALIMYNLISRWTPVQDRYVILVTTMEALVRTPLHEDKMEHHLALIAIVGSLLRSDVNLIGLSVMDVLLGLVKQMKRLFQQGEHLDTVLDEKLGAGEPSPQSRQLLDRLEQCVGDLATHVYYADQITDMIAAVLARLKPAPSASTNSTPQGEKTEDHDAAPGGSLTNLSESQSNSDTYFSYSKGRVCGLKVIRGILLVANPKTKISGNMDLSRNKVPLHVWEGSQWLLRDPDGRVRKAYVDALVTWLDRETTPADLRARDESLVRNRSMKNSREMAAAASRGVSNGTHRERSTRNTRRSQFLPLLHLAIYDNALQYVDYETDLVVLHVLLTKLVFRLGVNAVRFGIPMVYGLQEEIQEIEQPVNKVRIAALCHGYFWTLTEKFDFDGSAVGRAITNEVVRRRSKKFWIEGINIPPPHLKNVGMPGHIESQPAWDPKALETEELLPFDDRSSMVECIATSYEESSQSPPASPAASPGRMANHPILGSTMSPTPAAKDENDFPSAFREQMLTDWSRDAVVAALATEGKPESLNGSRTGTTGTNRNRLTINTNGLSANGGFMSPYGSPHNMRPHSARIPDRERYGSVTKLRKSSVRSGVSPPSSSHKGIASVDQLKMVLSGSKPTLGAARSDDDDDDSGDSMVSYDSPSELSFNPAATHTHAPAEPETPRRSGSMTRRGPLSSNPPGQNTPTLDDGEDVPPVPPLPNSQSSMSMSPTTAEHIAHQDYAPQAQAPRRTPSSRAANSVRGSLHPRAQEESLQSMDLDSLLRGIDSRSGEGSLGNVTKPPY
ncbi:uncharacterized protein F5Z01DRAFT_207694 [Emericellopsis atlantica]|uniref:Protein EFR3 n=1 Tax=Emericellopsis atlantica TaxID=2614577 RepID=A0A9P8CTA1_9HYPO|nr:uncharacterized protein F5Z01DRAFT_207694 [Emericellopsis atlantica]KAG9258628.1 hypothetical protein F5Z01DRAFT_207694 [Emericellopsis atlantica]